MRIAHVVLLAALLVVSTAAQAPVVSAATKPKLPNLLAKAKKPTGENMARRLRFDLLDPAQFKVVRRPSAASVTLGWPADRPCAFTTYTLSIHLDQEDTDAAARAVVPTAEQEGTASRQGRTVDRAPVALRGFWRISSAIIRSSELRVSAVATTPFVDMYSYKVGGLLRLRMTSRTNKNYPCATANQFRIGPHLTQTVILAAAGM